MLRVVGVLVVDHARRLLRDLTRTGPTCVVTSTLSTMCMDDGSLQQSIQHQLRLRSNFAKVNFEFVTFRSQSCAFSILLSSNVECSDYVHAYSIGPQL